MPSLGLAGLTILLDGPPSPPGGWGILGPFLSSGSPDLRLAWSPVEGIALPGWKADGAYEDLPGGTVAFRRADFEGRLDPATGRGELRTSGTPNALRSALRYVCALALLERDGFLLHSAGLRRDALGYVLCGPSGAGKTTAAGLSRPRAEVLSDEMPVLRRDGGRWRVWGTPFAGDLEACTPASAPLASLAFLEQSPEVSADPLHPSEALRRLYPQVFKASALPARHARWLSLASALVRAVPPVRLRFRRDDGFWRVLERAA